jgi:hypothetical protein
MTQDVGRNFKKGELRDLPRGTWDQIAKSAGKKLESFSEAVDDNPLSVSPLKRHVHVRTRLGTRGAT